MGFSLLLDGWLVNDSFVVTFFATLLSSEKPNGHCQDNTDAKNASQDHGEDDAQTQSCVR